MVSTAGNVRSGHAEDVAAVDENERTAHRVARHAVLAISALQDVIPAGLPPEEGVDAHAGQQRHGAFEVDHDFHDLDVGRPACAARTHARQARAKVRAPSPCPRSRGRGRRCCARRPSGPSLILATSCSSTSARTRITVRSPITISGSSGDGATSSPGLALTCSTEPVERRADARLVEQLFGRGELGPRGDQAGLEAVRRRRLGLGVGGGERDVLLAQLVLGVGHLLARLQ